MSTTPAHGFRPTPSIASTDMAPDELAQLAEVAKLLGVSKRTALKYASLKGFPAPIETLTTGRVWRRVDVARWGKAHLPLKTGRPRSPHQL
jgi:predicted DNA-binding transcriptional regulator AlpA